MSDGAVAGSWTRIVTALKERAPASARWINGPADAGTLHRLRSETGLPLPPELEEWLSLANGAAQTFEAQIIPRFLSCDAGQIIAANRMRHQIYPGPGAFGGPGQAAGSETDGWWPEEYWLFIPIATDGGGNSLVADLRDGDLRGCLMEWHREGGVAALWPGVAVMLADIAGALEHGRPEGRDPTAEEVAHRTRTGHLAVFKAGGTLDWQDYDLEQAIIGHHEIAAWARSRGYPVGARGRIPQSVVEAYERRQER